MKKYLVLLLLIHCTAGILSGCVKTAPPPILIPDGASAAISHLHCGGTETFTLSGSGLEALKT